MLWLWGDLKPIPKYLVADIFIVTCMIHSAWNGLAYINTIATILFTLAVYGTTYRWPLTMIMQVPILFLLLCRWYELRLCSNMVVSVGSALSIILSVPLLVLFPAVDLPPIIMEGNKCYNVGVVDVFLPVQLEGEKEADILCKEYNITSSSPPVKGAPIAAATSATSATSAAAAANSRKMETHVTTRIFYPTDEKVTSGIPYASKSICAALMNVTNPPNSLMSQMGFLIHSWCLVRLPVVRNAEPAACETVTSFPLAFYSHGLTGNSFSYSYQATSLAAEGYVVMMVEHRDGSASLTLKEDGGAVEYDQTPAKMWNENRKKHDRYRRKQTVFRATEMIAASRALLKLNEVNPAVLSKLGVNFCNRLDTGRGILACGHSFGGATALSVAVRVPEMCAGVVAHEPATDWLCDRGRRALFQADPTYTGGVTLGYEDDHDNDCMAIGPALCTEEEKSWRNIFFRRKISSSNAAPELGVHDLDLLFLFSEEWMKDGTCECKRIQKLFLSGNLGLTDGASNFKSFEKSSHSVFSDCCMLTPTWIGRATGLTGPGDPHDHADLIRRNTLQFIGETEGRRAKALAAMDMNIVPS